MASCVLRISSIGRSGSEHDSSCGWRCVACGEIIDRVIVQKSHSCEGPAMCQTTQEASSTGSYGAGHLMAAMWGIHRESSLKIEGGCHG